MRRDGRSLGDLIKSELGTVPGVIALFGAFMIMVIILAVLAMVVALGDKGVKSLDDLADLASDELREIVGDPRRRVAQRIQLAINDLLDQPG